MFKSIREANKLNRILKDIDKLILQAKRDYLSKDEAIKIYEHAVELFAVNFKIKEWRYDEDELTKDSSLAEIINYHITENSENPIIKDPTKILNQEIDQAIIDFNYCLNDELDCDEVNLDKEGYLAWGYDDDERKYKNSVLSYIELKSLTKLYEVDCFDFLTNSICELPSHFEIENAFVEIRGTMGCISNKSELSFLFFRKWQKRTISDPLLWDPNPFFNSVMLGFIPLGVESFYKFPNALKASYELCKLNNFQDVVNEMKAIKF